MAAAAGTVKKVALELGGKNPNIVFADADRETALDYALTAVFLHSGQVCSAGARLIVEASIHDEFVEELVERAGRIRLGGPFDELAETGPLIRAQHRDKVEAYVARGIAEGAVLRLGGALGVSRVVTSLGWRPHHEQVGQTGSRISPDLYVACGISGAIQHWAGCQSAKTILAINTDADAPMVTKAHYAVIGDLHEVVPAINSELKRRLA